MSAPERITVRCPHCDLMQFWTESGSCRRCHKAYVPEELLAVELESVVAPRRDVGSVGRSLLYHRTRLKLSQRQLALRLGIPRTYISKIEIGGCLPRIASLQRIAEGMGIDLFDLIGLADMDVLKDPFMQQIAPYVRAISADNRNILLANLKQMNWKASYK